MRRTLALSLLAALIVSSPAQGDCPPPFVLQWGSSGSGNGEFNSPSGVATDAAGNVYVADSGNNRIQKFSSTGTYLTQWGSSGGGNGQFSNAQDLVTDAVGNVYVADLRNNRIQKFTSTGTYLTQWGSSGSGNGQFSNPAGMAIDVAGNVYVAEFSPNDRIQKFTSTGTYLTQWGSSGGGNGQFRNPDGLATDAAGNVYVADANNDRIQKFTSTGTYLTQWGGGLQNPTGVATDAVGNVYVADFASHRIRQFTSTGGYLTQWGVLGSGNSQFTYPISVATDAAGNVYVADRDNNRIQRFGSASTIASVRDVANDQGRQVRIRWVRDIQDCPAAATPILQYEAFRRIDVLPPAQATAHLAARPLAMDTPGAIRNIGALWFASVLLAGWEFVGAVPAHGETEYNMVVPTLVDSSASGIHHSAFFIRAATAVPTTFFDSPVDSGYSADNLPPIPPAPFVAVYQSGATNLHWGANSEPDFWYYRVYRGSTLGFVPGPANVIATRADTGYVDVGPAGSYYKLSAVDVNGNESGYAVLTPQGTVDVADAGPLTFALEGVRPNPTTSSRMAISFVLPVAAPARLELVDVNGRLVAVRQVGVLGAGRHSVDLAAGQELRAGIYLVRLTQGRLQRTARAVVLH